MVCATFHWKHSSSPDMLLRPDSDSAVYTANFEEVDHKATSTDENIVWEGHGLMSWILNDNNHTETSVMARLTKPNDDHDAYIAEVLLQLHPVSFIIYFFSILSSEPVPCLARCSLSPHPQKSAMTAGLLTHHHADKPTIFRHIALPRPISIIRLHAAGIRTSPLLRCLDHKIHGIHQHMIAGAAGIDLKYHNLNPPHPHPNPPIFHHDQCRFHACLVPRRQRRQPIRRKKMNLIRSLAAGG
jgi:hypothetical protein